MAGQHAPVIVGRVGVGVEVDDPDRARPADLGDRRGRRPGDRMVAPQDDRDRAGLGDLADLAVDHRVGALRPGRHDVRVARVHDVEHLERLDAELERVDRSRRVLRLADRPRTKPGARAVAHRVIERRADDRHVRAPGPQGGRVADPGQVHERRWADVRGQVEVGVGLVVAVPAIGRGEAAGRGWVMALGHQGPPGDGSPTDRRKPDWPRDRVFWGRRRFESNVQRGAPRPS